MVGGKDSPFQDSPCQIGEGFGVELEGVGGVIYGSLREWNCLIYKLIEEDYGKNKY